MLAGPPGDAYSTIYTFVSFIWCRPQYSLVSLQTLYTVRPSRVTTSSPSYLNGVTALTPTLSLLPLSVSPVSVPVSPFPFSLPFFLPLLLLLFLSTLPFPFLSSLSLFPFSIIFPFFFSFLFPLFSPSFLSARCFTFYFPVRLFFLVPVPSSLYSSSSFSSLILSLPPFLSSLVVPPSFGPSLLSTIFCFSQPSHRTAQLPVFSIIR